MSEQAMYTVTGTRQRVGAIGLHEGFRLTVLAANAAEARERARQESYDAGWQHVHCQATWRMER